MNPNAQNTPQNPQYDPNTPPAAPVQPVVPQPTAPIQPPQPGYTQLQPMATPPASSQPHNNRLIIGLVASGVVIVIIIVLALVLGVGQSKGGQSNSGMLSDDELSKLDPSLSEDKSINDTSVNYEKISLEKYTDASNTFSLQIPVGAKKTASSTSVSFEITRTTKGLQVPPGSISVGHDTSPTTSWSEFVKAVKESNASSNVTSQEEITINGYSAYKIKKQGSSDDVSTIAYIQKDSRNYYTLQLSTSKDDEEFSSKFDTIIDSFRLQ